MEAGVLLLYNTNCLLRLCIPKIFTIEDTWVPYCSCKELHRDGFLWLFYPCHSDASCLWVGWWEVGAGESKLTPGFHHLYLEHSQQCLLLMYFCTVCWINHDLFFFGHLLLFCDTLSHLKRFEAGHAHQRGVMCLWLCYKTVYGSTIHDLVLNKRQNELGWVQSHPICSHRCGPVLLR